MESCRGASPSPSGRGWPEGPGEGRLVKNVAHSGPHPPLRGTLSRRERDSLQPLPILQMSKLQSPFGRRWPARSASPIGRASRKGRMRAGMRKGFGIRALTRRFAAPSPGGRGARFSRFSLLQLPRLQTRAKARDYILEMRVTITVMNRTILSCLLGIALSRTAIHAHHSIAGVYDSNRQITVEGIVAQFQFVNPH